MATQPECRGVRNGGVAALVLAGLLLLAGCDTEPAADDGGGERPTPEPAATGTLEQLARKAGCDPDVVAALRGRLGGTVETASPHHSGDSGGGGSEDGHSGHHKS